jgi:cysteine synthase A
MSRERIKLMEAYGAEVLLVSGGMSAAIAKAEQLAKELPHGLIPGQFTNPANSRAHFETTGPEIWDATEGQIDILVAGIGTGGTITGTGAYLKTRKPITVVGVEPATSAVLSGRAPGPHGIQGIGAGFIPEVLDLSLIDELLPVTEEEAFAAAKRLAREEGILAGISSGAALHAALLLASRPENANKTILTILPDPATRYLSTEGFL